MLSFADGLIGMEECCRWVLLADAQNSALGWLQCVDLPQVALAVVSPRRFVKDYQVRVSRRDIEPLGLKSPGDCAGAGGREPSQRFAVVEPQSAAGDPSRSTSGSAGDRQRRPSGAASVAWRGTAAKVGLIRRAASQRPGWHAFTAKRGRHVAATRITCLSAAAGKQATLIGSFGFCLRGGLRLLCGLATRGGGALRNLGTVAYAGSVCADRF